MKYSISTDYSCLTIIYASPLNYPDNLPHSLTHSILVDFSSYGSVYNSYNYFPHTAWHLPVHWWLEWKRAGSVCSQLTPQTSCMMVGFHPLFHEDQSLIWPVKCPLARPGGVMSQYAGAPLNPAAWFHGSGTMPLGSGTVGWGPVWEPGNGGWAWHGGSTQGSAAPLQHTLHYTGEPQQHG